ncbi:angiotonin transactivated protein 1 isoform 2 [Achlya hypogyna]|uniref:Angiotonin transactivated protein 1 isoform 2 n=1 Tax=Achlya hypogyna TaxID=1202772 RepID=A0A1V9YN00_ACHHY|nr:angiotonin transactivated protein 1 isoform 2 [Achlya hypogyna]
MSDGLAELGFAAVPQRKVLLVNDVVEASGAFLVHHLTSTAVKSDLRVCTVALANSLEQYTSIGRKMGANVPAAIAKKKWLHIDGFSRPYDWCAPAPSEESFSMGSSNVGGDLRSLFLRIRTFVEASTERCLIVVDDLTCISGQFGADEAMIFVRYCRHLAFQNNSTLLLLLHGDVACEGNAISLIPAVTDVASAVFTVRGLDSGYCKDIHGSVTVTTRWQPTQPVEPATRAAMQYKLLDTGVRVIRSGLEA